MARVIIEHADGRAFSVEPAAFRRLYEPAGFKVVGNEDGSPLEASAPKRRSSRKRKRSAPKPAAPTANAGSAADPADAGSGGESE